MSERVLPPIQEACLDTGLECVDCPRLAADGICEYLLRGQRQLETDAKLQREMMRGDRATWDKSLPGFRTDIGVERLIEEDPELLEALLQQRVGVEAIDIGGLKAVNDWLGYMRGDAFLSKGAERYAAVHRFQPNQGLQASPTSKERRASPNRKDTYFRSGKSDELFVIYIVDEAQELEMIHHSRVLPHFSIKQAVIDSQEGGVPIIANGATAHAGELPAPETAPQHLLPDVGMRIFNDIASLARERLTASHEERATALWEYIEKHYSPAEHGDKPLVRPTDDRLLIQTFWRTCCPDFYQNAAEILNPVTTHAQLARISMTEVSRD